MRVEGAATFTRKTVRKGIGVLGSGADRLIPAWRGALTSGLTVFIFHDITASPSQHQHAGLSYTGPQTFDRQLSWIKSRFTVVAPSSLPQFGGPLEVPPNAALVTFDDSWAGVFRIGIPMTRAHGISPLCFLNMATVEGDPDLAAVRRYEIAHPPPARPMLSEPLNLETGEHVLSEVRERYGNDAAFRRYQGDTATPDDLARVGDDVWFGSHLYHHWDLRMISSDLYEDSFRRNLVALRGYPNTLPAFATPHGFAGDSQTDAIGCPLENGARVVFVGRGNQNANANSRVLDRVWLTPEPSTEQDWWYSTHRRRLVGRRAS